MKNPDFYDYNSKTDRDKFVSVIDRSSNKKMHCYCGVCNNHLGTIDFSMTYAAILRSTNIKTEVLEEAIMPNVPCIYQFVTECKKCGRETLHYTTDYNIGKLIKKLNDMGLTTVFSCEGHTYSSAGFDIPYIGFKDDVSEYFDMNDPLLKYWELEDKSNYESPMKVGLYVSTKASMDYIINYEFIKDMTKYLNKLEKKIRR